MDGGNAPRFFDLTFNMIPDFWNHINSEVVGNLIMFIPFGILYSLAKKKPSMLLCGCEITAELVYGTIADSMFLGAIGFLASALTNNLPVSVMVSLLYYVINITMKSKFGNFNLFAMMNGNYKPNSYLFVVSIIFITISILIKRGLAKK